MPLWVIGFSTLLAGCQERTVTKALAEMDEPEIEVHSSSTASRTRTIPRLPLAPAMAQDTGYGRLKDWNAQPRLELAALVDGSNGEPQSGSVVPYLRSELLPEEAGLAGDGENQLILKAKSPARIVRVEWLKEGEPAKSLDFGGRGVEVAQASGLIQPGDSGELKVTLRQLKTTSQGSIIRSMEDRQEVPRFALKEIGDITSTVTLKMEGVLRPSDRPQLVSAASAFGRKLPLKKVKVQSDGVLFEMALRDYQQTLTISVPEERVVTLVLPVKAQKPDKPVEKQASASRLPFFRLVHEDPNKMQSQADSPA